MNAPVLTVALFALLLQSTFIAGIAVSYLAVPLLIGLLAATNFKACAEKILVSSAVCTVLLAVSLAKQVEILGALKSAVGYWCFFFTALAVRDIYQKRPRDVEAAARVAIWIFSAFFFLEYLGLFSAKAAGLAELWTPAGVAKVEEFADLRASGLYSEPSWLALALASLATVHLTTAKSLSWTTLLLTFSVMALCRSATGVLLIPLLVLLLISRSRGSWLPAVAIFGVITGALLILLANGILHFELGETFGRSFEKIINPFETDSGWVRFISPLALLDRAFSVDPFFGFGLGAVRDRLVGVAGTSILPLNVTLECGLLGVFLYAALFCYLVRTAESKPLRLALLTVNIFFLGLHTSAFQAALIGLVLVGPKVREHAAQHASQRLPEAAC